MTADETIFFARTPSAEERILPLADAALAAIRAAGLARPAGEPHLKLALVELVTNAMEHGNGFDERKHVTVTVTVRRPGERAEVAIEDEGPGLAPEELERDLDRVGLDAKRGRGLALVKRILGAPPRLSGRGNVVTIAFERGRFG